MKNKKSLMPSNKMNIAASYMHHFSQCLNTEASIKRTMKEFPLSRPEQILMLKDFYYPDIKNKGDLIVTTKQINVRKSKQRKKHKNIDQNISLSGFISPCIHKF